MKTKKKKMSDFELASKGLRYNPDGTIHQLTRKELDERTIQYFRMMSVTPEFIQGRRKGVLERAVREVKIV